MPVGKHRPPGRPYAAAALLLATLATAGIGALLARPVLGADPSEIGGAAANSAAAYAGGAGVRSTGSPDPVASPAPPGDTPTPGASPATRPTGSPWATTRPTTGPPALDRITRMENEVTTLVNAERAKAGCVAVRTDERLRTASRRHSADMATNDYFSHTGQDGSSPWDRAKRAGYTTPIGENIAYGYKNAADVVRGWMNSPGHRANILNCAAKATGTGMASPSGGTPYWTQLFGSS